MAGSPGRIINSSGSTFALFADPRPEDCCWIWESDCPEIYGDPGVLIARYIKPRAVEKKSGPLVIPHYSESKEKYGRYRTIDTKGSDFQTFVDTIAQSEIVVSSSLHGLIIAETYSVPVVLLLTSGKETLDKYEDYYLGTGRSQFPVAKTVEEALRITPCSPPDLHQIQENLVKAFPIDQWLNFLKKNSAHRRSPRERVRVCRHDC